MRGSTSNLPRKDTEGHGKLLVSTHYRELRLLHYFRGISPGLPKLEAGVKSISSGAAVDS